MAKIQKCDIDASVHSYQPVARGALLRYDGIKARSIKTDEHFGISQVELYNRKIHKDATIKNGKVQIDQFDGSRVVYERWFPLTKTVFFYSVLALSGDRS